MRRLPLRRIVVWTIVAHILVVAAIQAVPYGRAHTNPPVRMEPAWDSPATRELAVRACFDCHSNETEWPWYTNVAPMSWLGQRDVDEGRDELNFSEWDRRQEIDDLGEAVYEGMPPWFYTILHPSAGLSGAEKAALVDGFEATLGVSLKRED